MSEDGKPNGRGKSDKEQMITVTCQNCGEEITDSRANFKNRQWECPYCGGSSVGRGEE